MMKSAILVVQFVSKLTNNFNCSFKIQCHLLKRCPVSKYTLRYMTTMVEITVNNEDGVKENKSGLGISLVNFVKNIWKSSLASNAAKTIETRKENKLHDQSDNKNNSDDDDIHLELSDTFRFSENYFQNLRLVLMNEDFKISENKVKKTTFDVAMISQSLDEAEASFEKILFLRNKSLNSLIEEDKLSVSSFDSEECDQCKEWSVVDFENISVSESDTETDN